MSGFKRRVRFNLDDFIFELQECIEIETRNEDIDDVVQGFKDFLSRIEYRLFMSVMRYTNNHPTVKNNKKVSSFISACYKEVL